MNGIAISLRHVFQSYGKQPVLEDVSLEIPRGQTFALLGRNGSGKTTLIRTLLGLLPPRQGAAEVLGLDPARQALEIRSRIGYLAEDQAMYGWMTAAEIAAFLAPFYPTWDAAIGEQLFRPLRGAATSANSASLEGANDPPRPGAGPGTSTGAGDSRRSCGSASTRSRGSNSIATSLNICRLRGGRCFTARICCTKSKRWPTSWQFWTKAGSSARVALKICNAR